MYLTVHIPTFQPKSEDFLKDNRVRWRTEIPPLMTHPEKRSAPVVPEGLPCRRGILLHDRVIVDAAKAAHISPLLSLQPSPRP